MGLVIPVCKEYTIANADLSRVATMTNPAFDDIPGTYVFTGERAMEGRHLNRFCMSLMSPANRTRFKADERAYLDEWRMSEVQKQAVVKRDFKALVEHGGNIFFVLKIAAVDGRPTQSVAASFAGQSSEQYATMMRNGGRSPVGLRSIAGRF
jgi:protocatechuate 4,5-dioxygenase alpha chain